MVKPWSHLIPERDRLAVLRGFGDEDRPLSAGTRPAVVVVDLTRAFVDESSPLGWPQTGWPAVRSNQRLLEVARERQVPVFFANNGTDAPIAGTPVERGRWKRPHALEGGPRVETRVGDEFLVELMPLPDEITINKARKPSAFFGTPLVSYLNFHRIDTVIVTGMVTSGCVLATVLDAFQFNYHVLVPVECVADRSEISHTVSLFDMHAKYADVVSLEETLEYLYSVPRG